MNNEPAFPSNISQCQQNLSLGIHAGMTLRDYFAGQALTTHNPHPGSQDSMPDIARWSYEMADEMLKARTEQP
jgi:hypothetical protein